MTICTLDRTRQADIHQLLTTAALYLHIPFCHTRCHYCDFNTYAGMLPLREPYVRALLREIALAGELARLTDGGLRRSRTIFFGGGTPSALSVKQLDFLLSGLHRRLDLSRLREWTLEMNPATVSLEKARMLRDFGVNRISIGVQSWDPEMLNRLGRVHSAQQAERSFHIVREAGFTNLNLDLIFGVPGQSIETWQRTVEKTVSLAPEHISAYCLTFEEDTEFFRRFQSGDMTQDAERDASFYEFTMANLATAGYSQYEISNYAKPGYECLHNLAYWLGRNYLGLGPSAFSTIGERRWQNTPDTSRYIEQLRSSIEPINFKEHVSDRVRKAEGIAFGLRTAIGVSASAMTRWTSELDALRQEGYIQEENARIRLTAKGRMVADSIAELFV